MEKKLISEAMELKKETRNISKRQNSERKKKKGKKIWLKENYFTLRFI